MGLSSLPTHSTRGGHHPYPRQSQKKHYNLPRYPAKRKFPVSCMFVAVRARTLFAVRYGAGLICNGRIFFFVPSMRVKPETAENKAPGQLSAGPQPPTAPRTCLQSQLIDRQYVMTVDCLQRTKSKKQCKKKAEFKQPSGSSLSGGRRDRQLKRLRGRQGRTQLAK